MLIISSFQNGKILSSAYTFNNNKPSDEKSGGFSYVTESIKPLTCKESRAFFINIYRNFDWDDYGREMFEACGYEVPEPLEDFIDFEAYGKYIGEYVEEYSGGLIEILR